MKIYSFVIGYQHDGDIYNSYHKTREGATKAMIKYVKEFVPNPRKKINSREETIFQSWDATYYVEEIEVNDD